MAEVRAGEVAAQVHLAEYERLKEEQLARIGVRDNLIYATLAALGGVSVAAFGRPRYLALLVLPPVCLVLGWTYLANDEKVTAIGRYIRGELAARLAAMDQTGTELLRWETAHRSSVDRRRRKKAQMAVDLVTFCGMGLGGLAVFWSTGYGQRNLLLALSIAEAVALVLLGVEIVLQHRANLREP